MDARDIGRVLAKAAAFDQRTIGEADILAWLDAIGDLPLDDALAAITRHYRDTTDRIMPAHVRSHAHAIAWERRRAAREAEERQAIAAYAEAAGPLHDRSAEIRAHVDRVRDVLPDGDREVLRPRTVAWEREHRAYQRAQAAEPNPDFDPDLAPVPEWNSSRTPPKGAWWQDPDARERHCKELLAAAGRLRPRTDAA